MSHALTIQASSDPNYEDLIAECYVDDDCVMIVNQERGPGQLVVEVLLRPDGQALRIDYDAMVELLQKAKARLWELRKVPGTGEPAP
jgi:hypothetical protein